MVGTPEASLRAEELLNGFRLSDEVREGARPGLLAMLHALDRTDGLTADGRARADALLSDNLRRLAAVDADRRHYPEIAKVEIVRPVFILGLPRCGTSLLHAVIGADPGVRTPLSWEVADPSPPPTAEGFATDPRAKAFDDYVAAAFTGEWADMLKAHPIGAWIPQEDGMILEASFQSINPLTQYRMPDYYPWYLSQDSAFAYRVHRMFLQHLAWRNPRGRWVCKVQEHAYHLPALLAEYPDAMLVQPHRDPVAVQASICRLIEVLRSPAFDRQDRRALGQELLHLWHDGQERMMAFRRANPAVPILDLAYRDLAADPVDAVRRVYAFADIPFTAATEAGARGWLADNPAGKHGQHVYALEDYGLSAGEVQVVYADYIAAYREYL
ncbi:MAG: sulfotransferase family protein [Sphingobium sp.]|uniref:sulfotransferase family protein n=1 Tax=Sphingobium sp. TaxID=1912891 RepID=UPI000DB592A7|nr:sulfotransferase [Sphingobium sp.]PZU08306.1 MAG: sulfotransferase family protein [Sphingobium sp.]